jgi:hypothetical protein
VCVAGKSGRERPLKQACDYIRSPHREQPPSVTGEKLYETRSLCFNALKFSMQKSAYYTHTHPFQRSRSFCSPAFQKEERATEQQLLSARILHLI